jgi:hypothetical protein
VWDRLSGACCNHVKVSYGACSGSQSFDCKNIVCIADIVNVEHCEYQESPAVVLCIAELQSQNWCYNQLKLCGNGAVGECWRRGLLRT